MSSGLQGNPTGDDVLVAAITSFLGQVETSMPGRVTAYDPSGVTPIATVQLSVKGLKVREDALGLETYELPLVTGPVLHYGAGGGYIYSELKVDDEVLVLFASRDIDNAVETGEDATDPNTARRHHLMDALILPAPWRGVPSAVRIAGTLVIDHDTEILLGKGATKWAALAEDIVTRLNLIEVNLNSHVHVGAAAGTNPGANTSVSVGGVGLTGINDIKADKVKVE